MTHALHGLVALAVSLGCLSGLGCIRAEKFRASAGLDGAADAAVADLPSSDADAGPRDTEPMADERGSGDTGRGHDTSSDISAIVDIQDAATPSDSVADSPDVPTSLDSLTDTPEADVGFQPIVLLDEEVPLPQPPACAKDYVDITFDSPEPGLWVSVTLESEMAEDLIAGVHGAKTGCDVMVPDWEWIQSGHNFGYIRLAAAGKYSASVFGACIAGGTFHVRIVTIDPTAEGVPEGTVCDLNPPEGCACSALHCNCRAVFF